MTKKEQIQLLIGNSWYNQIGEEFDKPYMETVNQVLSTQAYYPDRHNIFRAFMCCSFDETKVVMIGQDPYHDGEAVGLCFSTKSKMNPSLKAILQGMEDDLTLGDFLAHSNNISYLADRGILMLNTALTVQPGKPGSHLDIWKPFTDEVIKALNNKVTPVVFLLWGNEAQKLTTMIDPFKHLVIHAEHPAHAARQNRPWEHQECFSRAEEFVRKNYGDHIKRFW